MPAWRFASNLESTHLTTVKSFSSGEKWCQDTDNEITELKVMVWDIAPFNDVSTFETFLVTNALIRLSNGKVINCVYQSLEPTPRAINGINAREYIFRINTPVKVTEVNAVGLLGTGLIEGYKVAGKSGSTSYPLFHLPSFSNVRSALVLYSNQPAWLPNYTRVNSFIDREAYLTCKISRDVSSASWFTVEVELTDGDVLYFTKKGPFKANSSLRLSVPAPYTLTIENIAAVRPVNAKIIMAFRRMNKEGTGPPGFFEYSFVDEEIRVNDLKIGYIEVGPGIMKENVLFQQSGWMSVIGSMGGAWYRRKMINTAVTTSALLFQFVTGNDDLRVNTKYVEYASKLKADFVLKGVPFGENNTKNITYSIPPDNCCKWDEIGYQMQGDQGADGSALSGYLNFQEQFVPRLYQTFLKLFMVSPNDPIRVNPFGPHQMASAIIPVDQCPIAYASQLILKPELGRAAVLSEQTKHGAFGMMADNWDYKGIFISYLTDQGWRRVYSGSGVDNIDPFMGEGIRPIDKRRVINLSDQMAKESVPMLMPIRQQDRRPVQRNNLP